MSHVPVWPAGHDQKGACSADISAGRPCLVHDRESDQILILPIWTGASEPDRQERQTWKREATRKQRSLKPSFAAQLAARE
jgi:hypothetical protein